MNDEQAVIKRPRGRPPGTGKHQRAATAAQIGYSGPNYDQIKALSDEEVTAAFKQLSAEPHPPLVWFEDECVLDTGEPYTKPALELSSATAAIELNRAVHRAQLLKLYLTQWIESLSDAQLMRELERLTGDTLSESATRYAKRSTIQEQVAWATWPTLISQSINQPSKEKL